jgi:NAD(P)-dependent dehydrogenase (short-subunit alcohol dehydrogenase family)
MSGSLQGKVALITGGTRGIGLATALALGREGASCVLTHKWGSADEDAILARFREVDAPAPLILEADAGSEEDTRSLLEGLAGRFGGIDILVCGVAFAQVIRGIEDYTRRGLGRSIDYTAWPMVDYTRQTKAIFGRYPRHVIGLSSGGPDQFYLNYDFVAASKAVLETLCRYLTYRLRDEDVRINVVRARFIPTESLDATFGEAFTPFVRAYDPALFVSVDEVAGAVLALTSGLLDAVRGQVLMIDRGTSFHDNFMRMYNERETRSIASTEEEKETP